MHITSTPAYSLEYGREDTVFGIFPVLRSITNGTPSFIATGTNKKPRASKPTTLVIPAARACSAIAAHISSKSCGCCRIPEMS